MMSNFIGGHPEDVPLTPEEKKAIRAINRVAKTWPESLWLFSASGTLCVMRNGENGRHVHGGTHSADGVNPDYIVGEVLIDNDGGDWR